MTNGAGCPCGNSYVQQIRHQKCPIIKLVREQINKAGGESKWDGDGTLWERVWQTRKYILALLVLLLLIWLVLMYGVFLGVSLCGTSPYKRKLPGFGLPGLSSTGGVGNAF